MTYDSPAPYAMENVLCDAHSEFEIDEDGLPSFAANGRCWTPDIMGGIDQLRCVDCELGWPLPPAIGDQLVLEV